MVIVRQPDKREKEVSKGIITAVDVPEAEVENFKDKLKEIVGKVSVKCETCTYLIACGEGN